MKRCPTEQGGCGQLHEFLFDSGLCQSCDAAVKRGTAAVSGPLPSKAAAGQLRTPKRRAARKPRSEPEPDQAALCKRGCGERRHRGKCKRSLTDGEKPKRKYVRRGAYPKVNAKAETASGDALMMLERLRSRYSDESAAHLRQIEAIEVKLSVLADVEAAIKRDAGKTPSD